MQVCFRDASKKTIMDFTKRSSSPQYIHVAILCAGITGQYILRSLI